jgi:hypothetical protein
MLSVFMLNVAVNSFMLSVVILNVVKPSVVTPVRAPKKVLLITGIREL